MLKARRLPLLLRTQINSPTGAIIAGSLGLQPRWGGDFLGYHVVVRPKRLFSSRTRHDRNVWWSVAAGNPSYV